MIFMRDTEAWSRDFEGIDVEDLLADEEPLNSALRDQRKPEEETSGEGAT